MVQIQQSHWNININVYSSRDLIMVTTETEVEQI